MNQDGNKTVYVIHMLNQIISQSPCRLAWIWLDRPVNQFVYSWEESPTCLISEYGGTAGSSSKTYMLEGFTWTQTVTILYTSKSFLRKLENAEIASRRKSWTCLLPRLLTKKIRGGALRIFRKYPQNAKVKSSWEASVHARRPRIRLRLLPSQADHWGRHGGALELGDGEGGHSWGGDCKSRLRGKSH